VIRGAEVPQMTSRRSLGRRCCRPLAEVDRGAYITG
jgi:hypothetical protein